MCFDIKAMGNKSIREKTFIKLLKSPGSMISASDISNAKFLPSDFDEFWDRLTFLLQEKQTGNSSNIINEKITAIVDKLLEYKCITQKHYNQFLIKSNLLQE